MRSAGDDALQEGTALLLEELRKADPPRDWRRDEPSPRVAAFAGALALEAPSWPAADRLEARLLLARLALDAGGLIEAACDLALQIPERRVEAFTALSGLAQRWRGAEARCADQDGLRRLRAMATDRIRGLIARYPAAPSPRLTLSRILDIANQPDAALDCFAGAPPGQRIIAHEYLRLLMRRLVPLWWPGMVARAFAVPRHIQHAAPETWPVFCLVRALCLAALRDQPQLANRLGGRDKAAIAACPAVDADVTVQAAALVTAIHAADPQAARRMLYTISLEALLLRAPQREAEQARQALLTEAQRAAEDQDASAEPDTRAYAAAYQLMMACDRFWADSGFRKDATLRVMRAMEQSKSQPARSLYGLLAFAREDYDTARDAFAETTRFNPSAIGASTYMDFRDVPAIIAARSRSPVLTEILPIERIAAGPKLSGSAPTLVISANNRYLQRHGAAYAASLAPYAAELRLHFHLIGDPTEEIGPIAEMAARCPGITFTMSSEAITVAEPYYFATARFLRLAALRRALPGPLLVTDIDWDWPASPAAYLARVMKDCDVGLSINGRVRLGTFPELPGFVRLLPRPTPWVMVAAGAMALAETAPALAFAEACALASEEALARAAADPARGKWTIDQNVLLAVYAHALAQMPGLRIADLGSRNEISPLASPTTLPQPEGCHWLYPQAS